MIKGGNRRMFRKPGRARQAIGILASSKELMDAAQASQMPMQPVQSFANGGLANNYLFDALGVVPPGFTRVGEGDDATLQSVPGSAVLINGSLVSQILLEHDNNLEWIC